MSSSPEPAVRTALGTLLLGDSLPWLRSLPDGSAHLAVVDPPYGIARAEWDTWASRREYVEWARGWLGDLARVLDGRGSAYVMGFSEVLADLKWACEDLFAGCRWLVWSYRNKGNLRGDWGRSHESLLHLRRSRDFTMNVDAVRIPYNQHTLKFPVRDQGGSSHFSRGTGGDGWTPNPLGAKPRDVLEVPILNNGMAEKTPHPTQKPEELIRRLVAASSDPGDLVIDPFAGSGTTAIVSELLGRRWLACEREAEYVAWAKDRIDAVAAGRHTLGDLDGQVAKMEANRAKVRG